MNLRPQRPERCALTGLRYSPKGSEQDSIRTAQSAVCCPSSILQSAVGGLQSVFVIIEGLSADFGILVFNKTHGISVWTVSIATAECSQVPLYYYWR